MTVPFVRPLFLSDKFVDKQKFLDFFRSHFDDQRFLNFPPVVYVGRLRRCLGGSSFYSLIFQRRSFWLTCELMALAVNFIRSYWLLLGVICQRKAWLELWSLWYLSTRSRCMIPNICLEYLRLCLLSYLGRCYCSVSIESFCKMCLPLSLHMSFRYSSRHHHGLHH